MFQCVVRFKAVSPGAHMQKTFRQHWGGLCVVGRQQEDLQTTRIQHRDKMGKEKDAAMWKVEQAESAS